MPDSNLHKLSALGQSVWIDYLSRDLLETGELERKMRDDAIVGVTSNPTIFQKAISQGERYDAQLKEILASGETDAKEISLQLSSHDIAAACDLLRPVWDGGGGLDGYVSWEVDPTLAYEQEATIAEARRLHEWIERPNLYVKIPATEPGLGAIEEMIASGRNINVTLIFSLERHKEVMEAYLRGVERLVESGGDPSTVHSVASFFVSRVDTETDRRLTELGGEATKLAGKLGIANAKLAYQNYLDTFSGPRWQALEAKGATKQRCLWASTSTKNPDYRDVMYVEELIGPETVDTMPEETIQAFQDHGNVAETLTKDVDAARQLFLDLREAGIDYDDVVGTLEREGVQKFSDSFEELMDVASQQDLVERVWGRDASVWTDAGEDKWLGWLDEPKRMQERVGELHEFAAMARSQFETFVLLGMGGSSLAPEVLKRTFGAKGLHVLDTTHPAMIRHAEQFLDLQKTMFVVSSKSGTTLETRSQFDYYWEQTGGAGAQFVAVTDPGSQLEHLAQQRGMRVFSGEPTIGGRYSALS